MNASEFYDFFVQAIIIFSIYSCFYLAFFFIHSLGMVYFFIFFICCMCMCHLLLFRLHSVWISMNFKQIINSQLECVLYSIMVFAVDWTISFAFSFPMLSFSLSLSHFLSLFGWFMYFFCVKLFACLLFRFTVSAFCDEATFYLQKKKQFKVFWFW